ncbi:MAG: MurR/RpiR family transcriptional regulator, partial [Erysipelotrichaceae bacterium]
MENAMNSPFIMKLLSFQPKYTVSENTICQFIVKNTEFISTNTISAIAKEVGVSEASINRFCKKVGYNGFNSFKVALAQDKFKEQLASTPTSFANEIESLSYDYQQLLLTTSTMLDYNLLLKASKKIENADKVYIVSDTETSFLSNYIAHKLSIIGFFTQSLNSELKLQLTLNNITENDVILVIASSLTNNIVYPFIIAAKAKKLDIISISSNDSNRLNDLVDVKIVTPDSNISKHPLVISNVMAFGFVFDVIFELMLKNNKEL